MNKVYTEMIPDPKPARTCVAVAELPMGTDVSMLLLEPKFMLTKSGRDRMHSSLVSMLTSMKTEVIVMLT